MADRQLVRLRPVKRDPETQRREAFAVLFDEHWSRVRHHIECFIDDSGEVDDVLTDVFQVAWAKLKPESPMGLTWLLRTADNKLRDWDRRARSREKALEALSQGAAADAFSMDQIDKLAIREALRMLSHRERAVVLLTYWDELSAGEIAEVLRCNQGAVWTALSRARTKLRAHLGLDGGGDGNG